MSTFYYAVDNAGDCLYENFPSNLKAIIHAYNDNFEPFEVTWNGQRQFCRLGKKTTSEGSVFTLTFEDKFLRRFKLFRELVQASTLPLASIVKLKTDTLLAQVSITEELIHNLTSLNSYNIQDLFALIPQKILAQNFNKQEEAVRKIIEEQPNVTSATLLKLIKSNLAMKVEFSVFERTQRPNAFVQKMPHSIRDLVLSILQIFIEDFEKKGIQVYVNYDDVSQKRIDLDYDSIFVSLFYLLENAVKYCCRGTDFRIIFEEQGDTFYILFKMISIRIEPNEVNKLTSQGYRSVAAKKVNEEGKGLGMYRITKTLSLNNAEIEIFPRINSYKEIRDGITYEGNMFKIKFKDQKTWFRK